jgi:hypothetical protein
VRAMRSVLLLAGGLCLGFAVAHAQAPPPDATSADLKVGPAAVAKHWSRNPYPADVPEGVHYYVVVKGDTLWDISARFLKNPLLWPQIWEDNKYIKNANLIYPGDPIQLKNIDLVADQAGQEPDMPAADADEAAPMVAAEQGPEENPLYPATEPTTMACAPYVAAQREDESLLISGSEQGAGKVAFADRDVVYLNQGSNAGIKPGDMFSIHKATYKVKHPISGKTMGSKIVSMGWLKVILAQEASATAVIEQACSEVQAGDYLKPFEKPNVPVLVRRPPPDRMTPPSGKASGYIIDIGEDSDVAGTGHLVILDMGSESGIAPGNMMTVYKIVYPSQPSGRVVLGELAVLAVRDQTALAKVMYSSAEISVGDAVELR